MISARNMKKAQKLLDQANKLDAERREPCGSQHYSIQRRDDLFALAKVLREEAKKLLGE